MPINSVFNELLKIEILTNSLVLQNELPKLQNHSINEIKAEETEYTPFILAIINERTPPLKQLIEYEFTHAASTQDTQFEFMAHPDPAGNTLIHHAILCRDLSPLEHLIQIAQKYKLDTPKLCSIKNIAGLTPMQRLRERLQDPGARADWLNRLFTVNPQNGESFLYRWVANKELKSLFIQLLHDDKGLAEAFSLHPQCILTLSRIITSTPGQQISAAYSLNVQEDGRKLFKSLFSTPQLLQSLTESEPFLKALLLNPVSDLTKAPKGSEIHAGASLFYAFSKAEDCDFLIKLFKFVPLIQDTIVETLVRNREVPGDKVENLSAITRLNSSYLGRSVLLSIIEIYQLHLQQIVMKYPTPSTKQDQQIVTKYQALFQEIEKRIKIYQSGWDVINNLYITAFDHRAINKLLDEYLAQDPTLINYTVMTSKQSLLVSYKSMNRRIDAIQKVEDLAIFINLLNILIAFNRPTQSILFLAEKVFQLRTWEMAMPNASIESLESAREEYFIHRDMSGQIIETLLHKIISLENDPNISTILTFFSGWMDTYSFNWNTILRTQDNHGRTALELARELKLDKRVISHLLKLEKKNAQQLLNTTFKKIKTYQAEQSFEDFFTASIPLFEKIISICRDHSLPILELDDEGKRTIFIASLSQAIFALVKNNCTNKAFEDWCANPENKTYCLQMQQWLDVLDDIFISKGYTELLKTKTKKMPLYKKIYKHLEAAQLVIKPQIDLQTDTRDASSIEALEEPTQASQVPDDHPIITDEPVEPIATSVLPIEELVIPVFEEAVTTATTKEEPRPSVDLVPEEAAKEASPLEPAIIRCPSPEVNASLTEISANAHPEHSETKVIQEKRQNTKRSKKSKKTLFQNESLDLPTEKTNPPKTSPLQAASADDDEASLKQEMTAKEALQTTDTPAIEITKPKKIKKKKSHKATTLPIDTPTNTTSDSTGSIPMAVTTEEPVKKAGEIFADLLFQDTSSPEHIQRDLPKKDALETGTLATSTLEADRLEDEPVVLTQRKKANPLRMDEPRTNASPSSLSQINLTPPSSDAVIIAQQMPPHLMGLPEQAAIANTPAQSIPPQERHDSGSVPQAIEQKENSIWLDPSIIAVSMTTQDASQTKTLSFRMRKDEIVPPSPAAQISTLYWDIYQAIFKDKVDILDDQMLLRIFSLLTQSTPAEVEQALKKLVPADVDHNKLFYIVDIAIAAQHFKYLLQNPHQIIDHQYLFEKVPNVLYNCSLIQPMNQGLTQKLLKSLFAVDNYLSQAKPSMPEALRIRQLLRTAINQNFIEMLTIDMLVQLNDVPELTVLLNTYYESIALEKVQNTTTFLSSTINSQLNTPNFLPIPLLRFFQDIELFCKKNIPEKQSTIALVGSQIWNTVINPNSDVDVTCFIIGASKEEVMRYHTGLLNFLSSLPNFKAISQKVVGPKENGRGIFSLKYNLATPENCYRIDLTIHEEIASDISALMHKSLLGRRLTTDALSVFSENRFQSFSCNNRSMSFWRYAPNSDDFSHAMYVISKSVHSSYSNYFIKQMADFFLLCFGENGALKATLLRPGIEQYLTKMHEKGHSIEESKQELTHIKNKFLIQSTHAIEKKVLISKGFNGILDDTYTFKEIVGNIEILRSYLDSKPLIYQDSQSNCILHDVAKTGHHKLFQMVCGSLRERGASDLLIATLIDLPNKEGLTPLNITEQITLRNEDTIQLMKLIRASCKVNDWAILLEGCARFLRLEHASKDPAVSRQGFFGKESPTAPFETPTVDKRSSPSTSL